LIYIVSGSSRAGKTIIANKILEEKNIPYLSLDWLVMGFTNGIPEYGIHDKLFPDEIAERLWSFLKGMCENMIWTDKDYVLEGEAVLPKLISKLTEKYPERIKVCFLGYTEIDIDKKVEDVKKYSSGENDWLCNKEDQYIREHIRNMLEHSKMIKKGCKDYNLKYFDTSKNFNSTIDKAIEYLFEAKE